MWWCVFEQEIHTLKTQLEAAKFDVIKYCIGKWSTVYLCKFVQEHKDLLSSLSFLEKNQSIQEFSSQRESSWEGIHF